MERSMNGEGQRPPSDTPAQHSEAPEPGNARYPQGNAGGGGNHAAAGGGQNNNNNNNNNAQQPQGEGRRRFRRNRRGGRGRRGKGAGQGGQNQQPAPLDAQGRIVDVENDG